MLKVSMKRILIAHALVLGLAGSIIVIVGSHRLGQANVRTPEDDYNPLCDGVERWRLERHLCPTVNELETARYIDPSNAMDPWGSPYLIECVGDLIKTHSLGPDRQLNTQDDVVVKRRRKY